MTDKRIKIILDTRDARVSAKALDSDLVGVGKAADGVQSSMTKVAAAVVAALSVRELVQYADAWTNVGNKIRQASNSLAEYEAIQAQVFSIAQSGRVDVEGVALAFQRIDNAVKEFGFSQADVLDVVDGLTKAFKANGSTAAEVSSILTQLSQGFGNGVLNGDELKSVMEASLPVAKAIAKEFGVNVGQLKDLGAEGKLVSERVFKAIKNELPEFQAAFEKAIPSIADSITVADNSLTKFIGTFNETTGVGAALSETIIDLSKAFDELSLLLSSGYFTEFGDLFSGQIDRALGSLDELASRFGITQDDIVLSSKAWSGEISQLLKDAFINAVPNVQAFVQIATVEIAAFADDTAVRLKNALNFEAYIKGKFGGDLTEELKAVNAELQRIEDARASTVNGILAQNKEEKKLSAEATQRAKIKRLEYLAELELNKELLDVERTRTATTPVNKEQQAELAKTQKRITGGEGKLEDIFAGREQKSDTLTQGLDFENELIRKSLETRSALYAQYGGIVNDINAGHFEKERARLQLAFSEQEALESERLQKELSAASERRAKIQSETELADFGRAEALRQLDEQLILQQQTTEQRLTEIRDQGRAARAELDRLEYRNRIDSAGRLGNALASYGQGQSKKIFEIGKKLSLAQAAVSLPAAVMESFKNGGGYPWGLIPAAAMAAQGLQQINAIRSTTFDGGGSGAGVSLGGGAGASTPAPQLPQAQEQAQSLSIIGSDELKRQLEEFAISGQPIPARTMLQYMQGVESARRIGP
jgi:tape measure domain-containing protein